jgi:formate dehydrogenase accessory protein FdhD
VSPLREIALDRWGARHGAAARDAVITEVACAIAYNGEHHALMMLTPNELADFAFGFSRTEGLIDRVEQLRVLEIVERNDGIVLELAIDSEGSMRLPARRRALLGASGCGLCGSAALTALPPIATVLGHSHWSIDDLSAALAHLQSEQRLNRASGGVHAAGLFHHLRPAIVREDVGRHNALDKAIGAWLRRTGAMATLACVSSRASFELVHKAASVGIEILAAISAPTSAAIDAAESAGLTLIGFARPGQLNVYTHPARINAG